MDDLSQWAAHRPQETAAREERSGEDFTCLRLHEPSARLGAFLLMAGLPIKMELSYVDGTKAREILDGYEGTVSFGDEGARLHVIEHARGVGA